MSYDSIFGSLSLDMLALESAVQLYEVENDIDNDYLLGDVSYDELEANESATENADDQFASDFAFGADLFSTAIAMESEGSDGSSDSSSDSSSKKKESFGSKLKNGIKSILSSIGKFFAMIGTKIREIGSKISGKIKEWQTNRNIKKVSKLRDAVIKEAGNVRKAYQQAVNILDNSIKTSATEVNKICVKINEAIKKAKGDSADFGANKDNLASVGKSYGDDAEKDISTMEKHVKNAETAQEHVSAAIDNVSKAYDELTTKMAKLKIADNAATRKTEAERVNDSMLGTNTKDMSKGPKERLDKIKEANKAAVNDFNDKNDKNKVNTNSAYGTETVTNAMVKAILLGEEYSQKTNLSKLQAECDAVASTCDTNKDFCSKAAAIADTDIGSDNANARRAFNLCKLYMRASKVFTMISSHITQLSTGAVFGEHSGDRKFAKASDE